MPPVNTTRFTVRGYSSAGRALAWHARGQRFDPLSSTKHCSHQVWFVKHLWGYSSAGERLHGMQEVSGSIPLSSTKFRTLATAGFFYHRECKALSG